MTKHDNFLTFSISEGGKGAANQSQSKERVDAIMQSYRLAFAGFSEAELLLLDGIRLRMLGPRSGHSSKVQGGALG